jgi:S-adenosylmethionine hydrolase
MASEGRGPLVALLSDLGTTDTYVGVMKAVILGICPTARIVDLCHDIAPQDIQQGAFLLDTAWPYCPEGTVHLIVVDPGVGSERRLLAVQAHGQHFVAPDNGVLTYVLASAREFSAFSIERHRYFLPEVSQTFHGRDILAPVAAHLASGLPADSLGPEASGSLQWLPVSRPVVNEAGLEVHVVHVDRFGNLVTDLSEQDFITWQRETASDRVVIRVGDSVIEEVCLAYAGRQPSELLALFGSTGRLEIAVNMGSAAQVLNVGRGAVVMVEARA